jgi:hypothetical protein
MNIAYNLGEEVDNPKCTFRIVESVYEVFMLNTRIEYNNFPIGFTNFQNSRTKRKISSKGLLTKSMISLAELRLRTTIALKKILTT